MILYFADRRMNILGQASTTLPGGYVITEDQRVEDVETGVATFSCRIGFDEYSRAALENMANAGNYILKSGDDKTKTEFYTIIDAETDTKNQDVYIYAEDAGLDLINEVVGDFEAADSYNSDWYINKYLYDSGFVIGINEIPKNIVRKLKWEGEESVTSRLASIATQFGGYEITYRFDVDGLTIKNRFVDIYKKRGVDAGVTLYLNRDIDKIITARSIANLATAFICEGAIPEESEGSDDNEPITFKSKKYSYDDGDFFVDGNYLKSRKANEKWSRYLWKNEPNQVAGAEGYIVRPYSYNTESAETLCSHAITELKKVCDMEINYEIDLKKLPENVKIGDRINIVDDGGEMYVSTRVLMLEISEVDNKQTATLGEHIIKRSGISARVEALAEKFAQSTVSVQNAIKVANRAQGMANDAKGQAEQASLGAADAIKAAETAQGAANTATASAEEATSKALAAETATKKVEESVSALETTVENAEKAIEEAKTAAENAETAAGEAKTAAENAETAAGEAKAAADASAPLAQSALDKANEASTLAGTAKTNADSAIETANAAKLDAEQAKTDVQEWAENELETFRNTISAEYARSTDLTETTATLQAQITANANQLEIEHSKIVVIDETANDARDKAQIAQGAAAAAQGSADEAQAYAAEAQAKADEAQAYAETAETEAENAQAAYETALNASNSARASLETAKSNLATVEGRADATEEEIAAARKAVADAQAACDTAERDASAALKVSNDAQKEAEEAVAKAENAQAAADAAALAATNAISVAEKANATTANAKQALADAATAQSTADTAKANAATAQTKADEAASVAALADQAAKDADAKAAQAQSDLNTAENNLANLLQRADATEEEIAAAEKAVEDARTAADNAAAAAATAQSTANTAKANAATAQSTADTAKANAATAQTKADEAKEAAAAAQRAVDGLAVRVTTAETDIIKNAEQIKLSATKTEVETKLGGYYTKEETDSALSVKADEISSTVAALRVGGRNLIPITDGNQIFSGNKGSGAYTDIYVSQTLLPPTDTEYVLSFDAKAQTGEGETLNIKCFFHSPNTTLTSESSTGQKRTNVVDGVAEVTITSEWKRYWVKWTQTPADTPKSVIVGRNEHTNLVYIRAVKLEVGNVATDWTPSFESLATKTEISQAANSITQTVSTTYATKKEVDDIEIGGRNLLLNTAGGADIILSGSTARVLGCDSYTNIDKVLTLNANAATSEIYYRFMNPSVLSLYTLEAGSTYTFSGKVKVTTSGGTLTSLNVRSQANATDSELSHSWTGGVNEPIVTADTTDWVYFKQTFTVEENAVGYYLSFQLYYDTSYVGTIQLSELKLEKGDKATGWTPAPEDVDGAIDHAQDTADNANGLATGANERLDSAESLIQQLSNCLATFVRDENGESMMTQTGDGYFFSMKDTNENFSGLREALETLKTNAGDTQAALDILKQALADHGETLEYVNITTYEDEPCIELGESDSNFKLLITNTRIMFMNGSNIPTHINTNGLVTQNIKVEGEIIQGGFVMTNVFGGGWGLLWKGESE